MKYFLRIASTHSHDTTPSVMVHFDSARYIFNCGEGTQRLYFEQKNRIGKLRTLFFTRTKWETVGGLPGMILTLADSGITALKLYGPRNLAYMLAATRSFMRRDGIDLSVSDISSPDTFTYTDENLVVQTIALLPAQSDVYMMDAARSSSDSDSDADLHCRSNGRKRKGLEDEPAATKHMSRQEAHRKKNQSIIESIVKYIFPGNRSESQKKTHACSHEPPKHSSVFAQLKKGRLPSTKDDNVALCYICQGPESIGMLDAAAAIRLGVIPGPDMGKLKAGQSVQARDGTTVHPSQCVKPNKPGAIFLIIDCPGTDYIQSLIDNKKMATIASATGDDAVKCIVHICGDGVLKDQRYLEWMRSFPPTTSHIYNSEKHNNQDIVFRSQADVQSALSIIDSDIFQKPYCAPASAASVAGLPPNSHPAKMRLMYQLEPTSKLLHAECLPTYKHKMSPEIKSLCNSSRNSIKESVESSGQSSESSGRFDDIALTTLGTASAIPGKYRNVSGSILETSVGTILLDCGEGTLGQMYRRFGPKGLRSKLSSLQLVFVSHMHADHHLGLINILVARNRIQMAESPSKCNPFFVMGPRPLWDWLNEYSQIENLGLNNVQFVDSTDVCWNPDQPDTQPQSPLDKNTLACIGLARAQTVSVVHCRLSFAIVLETTSGFKFAYSGDCRPSADLALAARDADLLLHEATLDDDMTVEAIAKAHCTIGEAIGVGYNMRAKNILLTHFSQRYPKIPTISKRQVSADNAETNDNVPYQPCVGVAFDLMRIRPQNFWKLPLIVPTLKQLFSDDDILEKD